jgi:glycosyltransferase involved in cell wall biosynthesis
MRDALNERPRLAILTNVLAPYRMPIYACLAEQFDVTVLYSGEERNRDQWKGLEHHACGFTVRRVRGFTISWIERDGESTVDARYLHVDPGLVTDLLRMRPQAVISNQMGFRSLVALAYGRLCRRPVWIWWGGTQHTERRISRSKRWFRRWFARRVSRWFSYGVTSTAYLQSLGVPEHNVVELQNCIPEGPYVKGWPPTRQIEPRPVLLCVGQLIHRKGLDLLLDAAARLQREGLSFSLMVTGSGPDARTLEQRAKELGLLNVYFRASEPPERMPSVYRSADVLVFPTREDVWGLVVNEALWSGLPALVSVYAGCAKELVPPSSTFDPLDPADFSLKLRMAVAGELPRPDLRRLRRLEDVAGTIAHEVKVALVGDQ